MRSERSASFEEFVAARGQALQRFGYLLTSDWGSAEELLQTALARSYPRWRRIYGDNPEAYLRKAMVNTWVSWRRQRFRSEIPAGELPDVPAADEYAAADRRQAVMAALASLPPRQRQILVLRYHQDLTEPAVAELLGISVGAVKSQSARGIAKLRESGLLAEYGVAPPKAQVAGSVSGRKASQERGA